MNNPPHSRRRFLSETFCFSAALGLGRVAPAQTTVGATDHLMLAIGDFGSADERQQAVADGMKRYVEGLGAKPSGLWLLGDNFYSKMEGGLKSKRWKSGFEDMYPAGHFPQSCWAVLGNHDYHDNTDGERVQLAYSNESPGTRWTMPAKWYRVDFPSAVKPLVTFLCLDSNLRTISGRKQSDTDKPRNSLKEAEETAQHEWLKSELAKPRTAPFLAVVAHHPLYSNGSHGDLKPLIDAWDALLCESGAHFYFCGHDHDLQHLEFEGHPTSFVISGGGGARTRDLKVTKRGPFSRPIYGFSEWRISPDRFVVSHFDANRKLLHAFEKTPQGKMTVL